MTFTVINDKEHVRREKKREKKESMVVSAVQCHQSITTTTEQQ
jgi:hypothetical protein